jgi:FlaA1/EpsC-like NDP-sugar epimerase
VKIVDLARNMIRLSGSEPDRDIAIEFIGVRPGEKLHEELWSEAETVTPSSHEAILLVTRPPIDPEWLEAELVALEQLVQSGDTLELVGKLNALVGAPQRATVSGDGAGAVETAPASETV